MGSQSIESLYLGWWKPDVALYVIKDWYEDTSFLLDMDVECVRLPRASLDSLAAFALYDQGPARICTVGEHIRHQELNNAYTKYRAGGSQESSKALVELSLSLTPRPWFSLKRLHFTEYPASLPKLPIYNRHALCVNCEYVWLEPFGGRDPDSNHCGPMVKTWNAYEELDTEQSKLLGQVAETALCPFFEQTTRYSGKQ
jgi:hypothetical protein